MNWACEFSEDAKKDLSDLPKAIQKRVGRILLQMEADPFQGNVKALQGEEWKGVLRRRIGDYRLLFTVDRVTMFFPCEARPRCWFECGSVLWRTVATLTGNIPAVSGPTLIDTI